MLRRSVLLVALASAGCATIFKGTSQNVTVSSSPSGASVVIRSTAGFDVFEGMTPASVRLAKKYEYRVTVSAPGYEDVHVPITHAFEGWFIGNLICGGIIGFVIDAVDGAMWNLEPGMVSVSLHSAGGRMTTLDADPSAPNADAPVADITVPTGDARVYAVFHARDAAGQLRSLAIPMVRKVATAAN
jgi:hypothetical protein